MQKYTYRRTQDFGGKAATPTGIPVPSCLFWRYAMYTIDRLVAAGVDAERAFDIVYCFLEQGNEKGLERYVCEMERGQRQRPKD